MLIGANSAGKSNLIGFFHSRLARFSGASARREVLPGLLMLVATPASDGANIAYCSDWVSRSTSASPLESEAEHARSAYEQALGQFIGLVRW